MDLDDYIELNREAEELRQACEEAAKKMEGFLKKYNKNCSSWARMNNIYETSLKMISSLK